MKLLHALICSDRTFWPFVVLLMLVLRGPTTFVEIYNIDESFYAVSARLWLAGHPPYEGFADMKPLLVFAYYRWIFQFISDSMRAVHGVTLVWALATAYVLYRVGRSLHGEHAGRLAAFLYTLFPASFMGVDALAANSEVLLNLPAALTLWAFISAIVRRHYRYYFLSGLALALSALFNFKGGAPLVAFALVLGAMIWARRYDLGQAAGAVLVCLAGITVPLLATYLYLDTQGVVHEALYWTFVINRQYISAGVSLSGFIDSLVNSLLIFVILHWLLLVFAWRRIKAIVREQPAGGAEWSVLLTLLVSACATCLGGRLYGHYLQQLYPSLCLLAARPLSGWLDQYVCGASNLRPRWVTAGFLVPFMVFALLNNYDYIFRFIPHVVLNEADLKSERVGAYLEARTPPYRSIFIWGFSPSIYYHSRRLPASRFVFIGPLVGESPGGRRWTEVEKRSVHQDHLWQQLLADLTRAHPLWILDTSVDRSFGPSWAQYPMAAVPPLAAWAARNYRKVGRIEEFDLWRRVEPQ